MAIPLHALVLTALLAPGGDKPLKSPEALDAWMAGYHARPEPARLRGALRGAVTLGLLPRPDVLAFFVAAHRANPEAKTALIASLPQEDLAGHMGSLAVLGSLGEDLADHLILLPDEMRGRFGAIPTLPDPRSPLALGPAPKPEEVQRILDRQDQALGAYRATGDPAYLRVLAAGLSGAADHDAFLAWAATAKRDPNPGPPVARGCVFDQARTTLLRLRAGAAPSTALKALARDAREPEWLRQELLRLEQVKPTKP